MPVRYDIAAGIAQPQQSYSPMNMLAQMQQQEYRDQHNMLAQAQLAEYQRQREEEEGLRTYMAQQGVDPMSEDFMRRVAAISPKYLPQLMSARATAQRDIRLGEEARARIGLAERRFQADLPGLIAGSQKAELEAINAHFGQAQNLAETVLQTGRGYNRLRNAVQGTPWADQLGDKMDLAAVRAIATQSATLQESLKPHLQVIEKEIVQVHPGIAGAPPIVRPGVVQTPQMAAPVGEEEFKGRLIPPGAVPSDGIPSARAPLTQRQYREAPAREQATSIFKDLRNQYEKLYARGSMAGEGQSMAERARNVLAGTPAGQQVARISDPKSQAIRDVIDKTIDQYVETKRASGTVSAQEVNTMDELIRLKSMLGSPTFDIDAVREILATADKYSGTGELFKQFRPSESERKGVIDGRKLQGAKPPLSSFYGK